MENKIAIIILNKSNNKMLFECLDSIRSKTQFTNYHIYIGDTGSSNNEINEIKEYSKKYFGHTKNISLIQFNYYNFAKNNNEIIKKYIRDENLILFCNNDIILIDDCISEAVKMYERNSEKIGTIGFKLLFKDESIQHAGQILIMNSNNQFVQVTHRGLRQNKNLFSTRERVIGNTMALLLTPKKIFDEIGGLSEKYIDCFEDVQYNLQCILNDKHNIYIGDKVAWHYESQTRDRDPNKNKMLMKDANDNLIPFVNANSKKLIQTNLTYKM